MQTRAMTIPPQSTKKRGRLTWAFLCLFVSGMVSGCQVPRYQFPGGYSSTYARHLHAEALVVPLPEVPPPVEGDSEPPGVFYPQAFKYQPPTRSEFQRTVVVLPEDRPAIRQRY